MTQTIMKHLRVSSLIMTILASSCGIEEVGRGKRPDGSDGWRNPSFSIDTSATARKVCFLTALDYPDGYDWKADPGTGSVKCSLVVYADGVPAMKIPVGNEYHVSSDPDMHRVIKGDLYTDFSTDDETIIKKNGKEIFRYSGREMLMGMAVSGKDVFTLGKPRQGSGFAYRKNGETIIERSSGWVFPRLRNERDSISFAFCENIESAGGVIGRYYHVMNGRISQIAVREDLKKVWDVICHEGQVCYIASLTGVRSPVLIRESGYKAMDIPEGMEMIDCRLVPAGKVIGIESVCSMNGRSLTSGLWKDGSLYHMFPSGVTAGGICAEEDGICCTLHSGLAPGKDMIFRCGETFAVPEGYAVMGDSPIGMMEGILNVGLSSLSGGKPMIWKDGKTQELDINGCICTLTVQ